MESYEIFRKLIAKESAVEKFADQRALVEKVVLENTANEKTATEKADAAKTIEGK